LPAKPLLPASAGTRYLTSDDALGPAAGRFFGDGHRKVCHHLRHLTPGTTADGPLPGPREGRHCLPLRLVRQEPAQRVTPHLSSIDPVALAARMTESCVADALGLNSEQRSRMWFRAITVRAASTPCWTCSAGTSALPSHSPGRPLATSPWWNPV